MKRYCKRTCGFCGSDFSSSKPVTRSRKIKGNSRVTNSRVRGTERVVGQCLDRGVDCRDKSQLCTNRHYKKVMKKMCPVTCNMCDDDGF
uniref:ShKT domain-containing protein n=1 Tax=Acrobeloides nanus TaxID=290746 RepID=A0A914CI76_9BILA